MSNHSVKMRVCVEAYAAGIYTQDEAIGVIIELLADAIDCRVLWGDVPEWAKRPILDFLMACDNSSVIYNSSSKSAASISPRLLELKQWLISEAQLR